MASNRIPLQMMSIGLLLACSTSCNIEKRQHLRGYNVDIIDRLNVSSGFIPQKRVKAEEIPDNESFESQEKPLMATLDGSHLAVVSFDYNINDRVNDDYLEEIDSLKCDRIVLRSGEELMAKVLVLSSSEVTYKACETTSSDSTTIKKEDVFMIVYANGQREVMSRNLEEEEESIANPKETELAELTPKQKKSRQRVIYVTGILTILLAMASWFVFFILPFAGVVLALISVLLAFESIAEVNRSNNDYKGKGLAIIGLILGLSGLIVAGIAVVYAIWLNNS